MDLQDVKTGLVVQSSDTLRYKKNVNRKKVYICFKSLSAYLFIGRGKLDLPVDSAWPEKSRVKDVNTVGGHDDLKEKVNFSLLKTRRLIFTSEDFYFYTGYTLSRSTDKETLF